MVSRPSCKYQCAGRLACRRQLVRGAIQRRYDPGCEYIARLFQAVSKGTPVRIFDEP